MVGVRSKGFIALVVSFAVLASASAAQAGPGITSLVSVSSTGEQANAISQSPSISGDGSLVTFVTDASNMVSDDENFAMDDFVRDRFAPETTRVSVSSMGAEGDGSAGGAALSA